ncbi:hypothetical protein BKA69DRAFT_1055684 [Paraphysoderma sedebokerense]|nr:hypothetical protein BKA69DRAFT_1055684 [Paraphysoderma sedebokerense]
MLNHNGQETPHCVSPLIPYSWNGAWNTTCKVRGHPPLRDLTFLISKSFGTATLQVENIVSSPPSAGAAEGKSSRTVPESAEEHATSFHKLLLEKFTIIYVISGSVAVHVNDESSEKASYLSQNETLVIERDVDETPTSLVVKSASNSKNRNNHSNNDSDSLDNPEVSTILLIHVASADSKASKRAHMAKRPPARHGSVIVYDDQPIQMFSNSTASATSATISTAATPNPSSPLLSPTSSSASLPLQEWELAKQYHPPSFSSRFANESEVPPPVIKDALVIEEFPRGKISTCWINMVKTGLSDWIRIPCIVARGVEDGPIVGITAAVHGNELNGIPCVHRVISDIDVSNLNGTVVGIPCVNTPGYLSYRREFADGKDLNRVFPGSPEGTSSQIYAWNLMDKIINKFNYLIDLHTASFGRVNSYYVRADMNDHMSSVMARLQMPQILLHNSGQDGTLRSAAMARGIKSITVEIGNPQLFNMQFVQWSYLGVMRIISYLNMYTTPHLPPSSLALPPPNSTSAITSNPSPPPPPLALPNATLSTLPPPKRNASTLEFDVNNQNPPTTILCSRGFWMYTKTGGVLEVYPAVNTLIKKGDLVARIKNIFGNIVDEYWAPCSGVTIGRSSNPVAMAGDRILHMGVVKKEGEVLAKEAKENY